MAKAKVPAHKMLEGCDTLSIPDVETAGGAYSAATEKWQLALQWGIYHELKKLNRLLHCHNATDIPNILRRIDKNTKKRPRKKKAKA